MTSSSMVKVRFIRGSRQRAIRRPDRPRQIYWLELVVCVVVVLVLAGATGERGLDEVVDSSLEEVVLVVLGMESLSLLLAQPANRSVAAAVSEGRIRCFMVKQ